MTRYHAPELARGALGALIGIAVAGASARAVPGGPELLPFIVAPMGACAVLLFAVPASPLAQPWPVLGGNLISTAVGLSAHWLFDDVLVAAAIGVGAAIGVMMLLGCLHPPGGACALLAATATPAIHDQGPLFVLSPVAVNTVVLLLVAIAVNNLSGKRYPHRPAPPAPAGPAAEALGITTPDVEEAMKRLADRLDVLPADIVAIVRDAETHALDRRLGSIPVARIMNTDVAVVHPFESIYRARTLIVQRQVKTLPVIDEERRVVGVVSIIDLFTRDIVELETVDSIMRTEVTTIPQETPVADLVPMMTSEGYKNVPVVDGEGRLAGMITRGELIAVLHRALLGAG
ncbi:HPP family protein [Pimelobacter simplex]|uniref:HPP family protein n=1 Tax=Nocardioides simplex TaxID=2045 RepID=UPI002150596E|nr:HPP family protein [Pimelobacter simplex]UUW89157.1 HPP family protein [Pimelobacter simplex]UUW98661.1 HPP family protein [Pimelobacter simplex]